MSTGPIAASPPLIHRCRSCLNTTATKVALLVAALLFAGGAVAAHFYLGPGYVIAFSSVGALFFLGFVASCLSSLIGSPPTPQTTSPKPPRAPSPPPPYEAEPTEDTRATSESPREPSVDEAREATPQSPEKTSVYNQIIAALPERTSFRGTLAHLPPRLLEGLPEEFKNNPKRFTCSESEMAAQTQLKVFFQSITQDLPEGGEKALEECVVTIQAFLSGVMDRPHKLCETLLALAMGTTPIIFSSIAKRLKVPKQAFETISKSFEIIQAVQIYHQYLVGGGEWRELKNEAHHIQELCAINFSFLPPPPDEDERIYIHALANAIRIKALKTIHELPRDRKVDDHCRVGIAVSAVEESTYTPEMAYDLFLRLADAPGLVEFKLPFDRELPQETTNTFIEKWNAHPTLLELEIDTLKLNRREEFEDVQALADAIYAHMDQK